MSDTSGCAWAIVPLKGVIRAKERLADALAPKIRRQLALAMYEDVLSALSRCPRLAGTLVVTDDPAMRVLASRFGAECIASPYSDGLNGAVRGGRQEIQRRGAKTAIYIAGDLPQVEPDDIDAVLDMLERNEAVLVQAAVDGGTNLIATRPPTLLPEHFGPDSFRHHLESARALGIEPAIGGLRHLGVDLDRPDDLPFFEALGRGKATAAVLRRFDWRTASQKLRIGRPSMRLDNENAIS